MRYRTPDPRGRQPWGCPYNRVLDRACVLAEDGRATCSRVCRRATGVYWPGVSRDMRISSAVPVEPVR